MTKSIRSVILTISILVCFLSLCSCGKNNDDSWRIEAGKKLADYIEPLDAGKVVIEDELYDFPMHLDVLCEKGWKISDNYQNAEGFMLESGYATNEFELIMDTDSNKSLMVIVVNMEVKPQGIQNCFVQNLHIDFGKHTRAMLPGKICKGSTKEEIMKNLSHVDKASIKEISNDEQTKITVNFNGNDGWNCNLIYEISETGLTGIDFAITDDNEWREHSDFGKITDTKDYLAASFDAMYHGNYTNYAGIYDTRDSAEQLYRDTLTLSRGYMGKYFDFNAEALDDDQKSRLDDITKKLLEGTKYNIRVKEGIARIKINFSDFLKIIDEDIKNTIQKFSEKYPSEVYNKLAGEDLKNADREYFEAIYKDMDNCIKNISFASSMEIECEINKDNNIESEKWKLLDVIFLGFGELME